VPGWPFMPASAKQAPGKGPAPAPAPAAPAPGKATQPQASHGAGAIDYGTNPTGPGFFLSPQQRSNLFALWIGRLAEASKNCTAALSELRTDELLRKEQDLSVMAVVVIDVIAFVGGNALKAAVAWMKAVDENALLDAGIRATPSILQVVRSTPDAALAEAQKQILSFGKQRTSATVKGEANADVKSDKAQKIDIISVLRRQVESSFQDIRENLPNVTTTDAQMLQMWRGYDVNKGHHVDDYKAVMADKLKRLKATRLHHMGHGDLDGRKSIDERIPVSPRASGNGRDAPRGVLPGKSIRVLQECIGLNGLRRHGMFEYRMSDRGAAPELLHVTWISDEFRDVAIAYHKERNGPPMKPMFVNKYFHPDGSVLPNPGSPEKLEITR